MSLLELKNVSRRYRFRTALVDQSHEVLAGVSLRLDAGRSLGVAGESGCGKTTLARLVSGMLRPSSGNVLFEGIDIHAGRPSRQEMARRVQLVWQDAPGSLDPRLSIGRSLSEPLRANGISGKVGDLLARVGLDESMSRRRPGELSGGELQRVAIARALSTDPKLLVCDEPAASLDINTRLKIVDLLAGLRKQRGLALMLITHDLALAGRLTEDLVVMYRGRIVESGPTGELLACPLHPYTNLLLASEPLLGRTEYGAGQDYVRDDDFPEEEEKGAAGCPFYSRCPEAVGECRYRLPELTAAAAARLVACPPALAKSRSGAAAV